MQSLCTHLTNIKEVSPNTTGCEECMNEGRRWVHLRMCMECGHIGCCDQSPGKHATAHFHTTGHPIIQSREEGEDWMWCYIDEIVL